MTGKWLFVVALCATLMLAGCASGGSSSMTATGPSTAQVSLTMTDDPPAGVAVLSFEVTITKAVLQPGNVPLISKPTEIEVSHLRTAHALLDSLSVPAGSYTGVDVTFSNADLAVINNSASAIGSCAVGATCELHPTLPTTPVSFTGAPFPLTIAAGSPLALLLDFNLQQSIQADLSLKPVITITKAAPAPGTGDLDDELDDVIGQVIAIDTTNKTFTLQVGGPQGKSEVIHTDSKTRFGEFDEGGMSNGFASIAMGQILKVDVALQSDSTLLAKRVEMADNDQHGEIAGVVSSVDSATQFKIAIHDEEMNDATAHTGMILAVTLQSGATFTVDSENLTIPSGLTFASSSDLMVGQEVQIHPLTVGQGTASTDRVRLRFSHVSGTVSAFANPNFSLINLPTLFTGLNPSITSLSVVGGQAVFSEMGSLSGLANGNQVSVSGLLFKGATTPTLVAHRIRLLQ